MLYQDLCPLQNDKNTDIPNTSDIRYAAFIDTVRVKCQTMILSDEDLAALTCDEILHSYTRDERNYK